MTNSFFVIIVTLIITFSIWIVKNCHQALYRYSFFRISPCTTAVLPHRRCRAASRPAPAAKRPIFSEKHNPQYHSTSDTIQYLPACQQLPGCESFNKPLLPPDTHLPDTDGQAVRHLPQAADNTHGQEKIPNSIMIIIIIMISIRWIYILKNTHKNTV